MTTGSDRFMAGNRSSNAWLMVAFALLAGVVCASRVQARAEQPLPLDVFYSLFDENTTAAQAALKRIRLDWREEYAAMLLESVGFVPSRDVRRGILSLLAQASGAPPAGDLEDGIDGVYRWLWSVKPAAHPEYAEFKAGLYELIDPRFREYFDGRPRTLIRLDEIRWGGVARDGIPPLVNPKMIRASQADYLAGDDVVFGIAIDGDVRAYPKRILAWHEMVRDSIAGRPMNGVYCTLCGAMVLYDVTVNGVQHVLGTSGFLYRSNKLMYDHATKSLWSTLTGAPVVGALVGQGIELEPLHVVTTTWSEWKKRHPRTLVLSLETGYQRDYSEGAAYREYFSSDRLMFGVPKLDARLPNKAEVVALRFRTEPDESMAISAEFLNVNRVYHDRLGRQEFVVFTDGSGANRVYESPGIRFVGWDGEHTARDSAGGAWKVGEGQLAGPGGRTLERLPAHRAFWFGWHAAYPTTRLVN
jgi:hypothetical protein